MSLTYLHIHDLIQNQSLEHLPLDSSERVFMHIHEVVLHGGLRGGAVQTPGEGTVTHRGCLWLPAVCLGGEQ